MSLDVPGVWVLPLSRIGEFFTMMGYSFKVFKKSELQSITDELVLNVKKYAPRNTGLLKSRIMGTSKQNYLEVSTMVDYAVWVEVGVFGKDKSKMIATPEFGGTIFVRSPDSFGSIVGELGEGMSEENAQMLVQYLAAQTANRIRNGYAQFMRAGLYDTMPTIIKTFKKTISNKIVESFRAVNNKAIKYAGSLVTTTI